MLSPHPSYPPLEMASCGGLVVTNTFANKDADALRRISGNIVPAAPSVESIAESLFDAWCRVPDLDSRRDNATISAPATWSESFSHVVPRAIEALEECRASR